MFIPTSSPIQYAEFRLGFLAEPVSVRVARTVVRSALETWGLAGLIDGSVLVISELVTNGAKAGPGEWMEMSIRLQPDGVLLSCWDSSSEMPVASEDDLEAEGGRGMFVIACYAAKVGTDPEEGRIGKSVWALMALPGRVAIGA
jgi:hypothetical protein